LKKRRTSFAVGAAGVPRFTKINAVPSGIWDAPRLSGTMIQHSSTNGFHRAYSLHAPIHSRTTMLLVKIHQGFGLAVVDLQPLTHRIFLVVFRLSQWLASFIIHIVYLRRIM